MLEDYLEAWLEAETLRYCTMSGNESKAKKKLTFLGFLLPGVVFKLPKSDENFAYAIPWCHTARI